MIFRVPVLGAEDEATFALEAEEAYLLSAGPAKLLVSLYLVNSINPITYLNLGRFFLALFFHRRLGRGCGFYLRNFWLSRLGHGLVLGGLWLLLFGLLICFLR